MHTNVKTISGIAYVKFRNYAPYVTFSHNLPLVTIVLLINDNMYDSEASNSHQLLIVPKYQIPESDYWMSIGYFLVEDTVNTCYNYYNQSIHIKNHAQ